MDSTNANKPTNPVTGTNLHNHPAPGELLASAKIVSEAARNAMSGKTDTVEKAKVAEAAADLLDAASHYGKMEDSSYGKYLEKAEDYLHKYGASGHTATTGGGLESHGHSGTTGGAHSDTTGNAHPGHTGATGDKPAGDHEGGGVGDYINMAKGFLSK